MQTVRTKGLKSRRLDIPPVVFIALLALLAGLAVLSWAVDRPTNHEDEIVQQSAVILPNAAEDARLVDENVNHPDVVGDGVIEGVGTVGTAAGVYPEGVMEATDVQLNRAVPVEANPELISGVARTLFLEQNVMLPGDVGHLDDRALSMQDIRFLEWNTFLPDGDAVAFTPPGSDHAGMGMGFTRF